MPRMDGTGPAGAGSMTGRGLGPCGTGEGVPAGGSYGRGMGYPMGMRFGRGMGMRCGRGFGPGRGYGPGNGYLWNAGAPMDDEARKAYLQQQRDYLKTRLDAIDKNLEKL